MYNCDFCIILKRIKYSYRFCTIISKETATEKKQRKKIDDNKIEYIAQDVLLLHLPIGYFVYM